MNWEDECYLLSKRKFRENSNIINVFTKSKGKVSGVVYGGNSRKIRNYLQLSNKLFVVYNSKNENKAGYFKTELIKPVSPSYFNDKKRTSALISLCSILNILLPELQPNQSIFKSFEKLIESLNKTNDDKSASCFPDLNHSTSSIIFVSVAMVITCMKPPSTWPMSMAGFRDSPRSITMSVLRIAHMNGDLQEYLIDYS